jgi:hypothetical protein
MVVSFFGLGYCLGGNYIIDMFFNFWGLMINYYAKS